MIDKDKINNLINDYTNNQLTDDELQQMTDETCAQIELVIYNVIRSVVSTH